MFLKTANEWVRFLKLMAAMSLTVVLIGAGFAVQTCLFIQDAKPSIGTIKRFVETKNDDGETLYAPVFTFTDHTGRKHQAFSSFYQRPPKAKVGDKIKILYDPDFPSHAKEDHFFSLWGVALVASGLGTISFVSLYFPVILISRIRNQKESDLFT